MRYGDKFPRNVLQLCSHAVQQRFLRFPEGSGREPHGCVSTGRHATVGLAAIADAHERSNRSRRPLRLFERPGIRRLYRLRVPAQPWNRPFP